MSPASYLSAPSRYVGPKGFEPPPPRLKGVCARPLHHGPIRFHLPPELTASGRPTHHRVKSDVRLHRRNTRRVTGGARSWVRTSDLRLEGRHSSPELSARVSFTFAPDSNRALRVTSSMCSRQHSLEGYLTVKRAGFPPATPGWWPGALVVELPLRVHRRFTCTVQIGACCHYTTAPMIHGGTDGNRTRNSVNGYCRPWWGRQDLNLRPPGLLARALFL